MRGRRTRSILAVECLANSAGQLRVERMEETAAFIVTGSLLALGIGLLCLRDYFKPAEVREQWYRAAMPVARFLFISMAIFIVLIVGYGYLNRCVMPVRPRNSTASTMNILEKAMFMYADDSGGRFPSGGATPTESLWLLYPKYVKDPRAFLNPNEGLWMPGTQPLTGDPKSRIAPEYLSVTGFSYMEGHAEKDATETILFERSPSKNGRNVLVGAGTVEFVSEPDFQKRNKLNDASTTGTAPSLKPDEPK